MPFKSKAQQRFMFAAEKRGDVPKGTAGEWARASGKKPGGIKALPEKVKKTAEEMAESVVKIAITIPANQRKSFTETYSHLVSPKNLRRAGIGAAALGAAGLGAYGLHQALKKPGGIKTLPEKVKKTAGEMAESLIKQGLDIWDFDQDDPAAWDRHREMLVERVRKAAEAEAAAELQRGVEWRERLKLPPKLDEAHRKAVEASIPTKSLHPEAAPPEAAPPKAAPPKAAPRTMSGTGAQAEQNVKDLASHLKPRYSRARIGLALGAAGLGGYGLYRALKKDEPKTAGWEEDMMAGLQRTMSGTGAQAEQNVKNIAEYLKPRYSRARIGLGLGAAGVAAYGLHQALKKKDEPKTASDLADTILSKKK